MLGGIGGPELLLCLVIVALVAVAVIMKRRQSQEQRGLIRCDACDRRVSRRATACPHCGDPI